MKYSLLSLAITSIIFSSANVIASEVEQTSPNSLNKAENAIETIEVTGRAFSLYLHLETLLQNWMRLLKLFLIWLRIFVMSILN